MKITYRKALAVFIGLILLLSVVPSLINFVRLVKEYQQGPSVEAAMDSSAVSGDEIHGLYYKFVYEDKDAEGNARYHFISTGGENVPKAVIARFEWNDSWTWTVLPQYHPGGWYYNTEDLDEWKRAFIAWIKSPNYDGRYLSPNYEVYVPKKSQEASSSNDVSSSN